VGGGGGRAGSDIRTTTKCEGVSDVMTMKSGQNYEQNTKERRYKQDGETSNLNTVRLLLHLVIRGKKYSFGISG
jgi:hypothetical protein